MLAWESVGLDGLAVEGRGSYAVCVRDRKNCFVEITPAFSANINNMCLQHILNTIHVVFKAPYPFVRTEKRSEDGKLPILVMR